MGCLIILANARLDELEYESEAQSTFFKHEFDRVFCLKPNPMRNWKVCKKKISFLFSKE
jgi:hypothetical protein